MGGGENFPRRIYKNPPIVEAVCTFSFASDSPWNLTVPGRFYERVRSEYPDEPEERSVVQANIEPSDVHGAGKVTLGETGSRIAFKNGPKILTIAPRNLGVHSLAPYEGWESFSTRSLDALTAYREVLGDNEIVGIGLRYVNRILVPDTTLDFVDYFTISQGLPAAGFPGSINSFFDRMELSYSDAPVKITFTWASDDQVADQIAFIMDFDLVRRGEFSVDEIPSLLDDLRVRERAAFESLIQDKLRGLFDASN